MKILFQLISIIFALFIFLTVQSTIYAQTSYTLQYPSYMPGNKMYTIAKCWETIKQYWSFGNLSQFSYQLRTADKYLVEAETLLTRKQYRLGFAALEQSDEHFILAAFNLAIAGNERKDTTKKKQLYTEATNAHIMLLNELLNKLPTTIHWKEENGYERDYTSSLELKRSINSRKVSNNYVNSGGKAEINIPINK